MTPTSARTWLETLAFSSTWLALGAGALVAAASAAMGIQISGVAIGLAICGTLVVYNIDRLRDLERDRRTSPNRSAFVSQYRGALTGLVVAAGLASVVLGIIAGCLAGLTLLPVLGIGLLHRRLKQFATAKTAYITLAWLSVVVGLPFVLAPTAGSGAAWVSAVLASAIGANAIASNVRDSEAAAARFGETLALRAARALALSGVVLCALGPRSVVPLVSVPLATWIALIGFRPTERYSLLVVDGALLAGGLMACITPAAMG